MIAARRITMTIVIYDCDAVREEDDLVDDDDDFLAASMIIMEL
jgi:hypothetical protein